jgi:hypothetical protein
MQRTKRHPIGRYGVVPLAFLLALTLSLTAGCLFSPEEETGDPPPPPPPVIPPPTTEDNIIEALEVIYNDKVRSANERYLEYANLFPPEEDQELSFLFIFQPDDVEPGEEPTWGLSGELDAHQNMFRAQENREIFSLELAIIRQPAGPIEFPDPGQEDWTQILATNVNLRLMLNANDSFLVDGGQADFKFAPKNDRFYLVEWKDLPRP